MTNKLFVYGTLAPGRPNEHVMKKIGGTWQEGSVRGILIEKGWGASMGYPGIELDEEGDEIEGFLFSSENLEANWGMLDEFEGEEYQRVLTKVELKNGKSEAAYIYMLKG